MTFGQEMRYLGDVGTAVIDASLLAWAYAVTRGCQTLADEFASYAVTECLELEGEDGVELSDLGMAPGHGHKEGDAYLAGRARAFLVDSGVQV